MKETMTARERVLKALRHKIPDRVPIDLGGFQTGIHKNAYENLLTHLGIEDTVEILDPVQQLAQPCEQVLERFHVDIRYILTHSPETHKVEITQNIRDGRLWHDLTDEFGVVWSMPNDFQLYMDISHHPLAEADVSALEEYPFPDGGDRTRFEGVREEALRMRKETPYALSTGIGGVVYEICWYLRGLEQWFMDMKENPGFCQALLEKILQFWMDYYSVFMSEVGDLVDVVMIGDDLAGQNGPLFSPDFYRQHVKPCQKRLISHIRSLTMAKVWYHTCGSAYTLIPDLLDIGIDILNPVQISARNMDPLRLKEEYGGRLVFWGGSIDSQHVLPFARPQEVRKHVRRNVGILKDEGGYVFNNVHNLQADVPAENIVAMYDAAYEFGFYDKEDGQQ